MRTIVVYRGRWNKDRAGLLIWKLVCSSGIGYEEIHFTDLDGKPIEIGPDDYTELSVEYTFRVEETDVVVS